MKLLVLVLRGLRHLRLWHIVRSGRDIEAFDAFETVDACDVAAFAFWDPSAHRAASSFATSIATRRFSATIWLVPTVSGSTNHTLAVR